MNNQKTVLKARRPIVQVIDCKVTQYSRDDFFEEALANKSFVEARQAARALDCWLR